MLESSAAQILGVNPLALAPVALMIVACGAAAAYVPARRAVLRIQSRRFATSRSETSLVGLYVDG